MIGTIILYKEGTMGWRFAVEIIAVLIMFGAVGGIYYGVMKGIVALNLRTVQFLAISFIVPAILVLAMERAIGSEATSALIGIMVGYALSVIGKTE
jgi:hypothetical protein